MTTYIMSKREFNDNEIKVWLEDHLQPGDYSLTTVPDQLTERQIIAARAAIEKMRERGRDAASWERILADKLASRDDRPQLTFNNDESAVLFALAWDGAMVLIQTGAE